MSRSTSAVKHHCPSCRAGLQSFSEFAYCATCGLIVTDVPAAANAIAALREKLSAAIGDISFNFPNVLATLNEGAWWRLSDGHAVHFTAGSLARFARSSGFEILDLSLAEDDRTLRLHALRSAAQTGPRFDVEDDLLAIAAGVEAFPAAMERQIARWRRVIEETLGDGRRVVIRGSDTHTGAFLAKLNIDASKLGHLIDTTAPPDVVIALDDAVDRARRELREAGLRALVLTP